MAGDWPTSRLVDVAEVRISNVDKKTHSVETPVKLCNYMDVYANDYVTNAIDFMSASASHSEIERFSLLAGDVVITKDSETPDDIGVPAVIAEQIDGLVCGYHLALIRPNQQRVHPIFLAKQLASRAAAQYFSVHASGSTRFGLPIGAIEALEVLLPPTPEQHKIAAILSTVDRAIDQTDTLIAKRQRIKTGLLQDLLTRGIDEHNNLRCEETHEFKDSSLGRVPAEWEVVTVSSVLARPPKNGYSPPESDTWCGGYMLGLGCLTVDGFVPRQLKYAPKADRLSEAATLSSGDFLISRSNTRSLVGLVGIFEDAGEPCIYPDLMVRLSFSSEVSTEYMEQTFMSADVRRQIENAATGTSGSMVKISAATIRGFTFKKPPLQEQLRILSILGANSDALLSANRFADKLRSLRRALTQDLLTGKVPIPLLSTELPDAVP